MKNRMSKRKTIGKISSFLKNGKSKKSGATETRRIIRGTSEYPSSTKVGAGSGSGIRRRLPYNVLHRRNHRVNDIVRGPIQ